MRDSAKQLRTIAIPSILRLFKTETTQYTLIPMGSKHDDPPESWLAIARTQPIGFSQVREDALIDLELMRRHTEPKVLMVGSGGCTLAALVGARAVGHVIVVDSNPAQLALCRIKVALLSKSFRERLEVLGHRDLEVEMRAARIKELLDATQADPISLGDLSRCAALGLDHVGRYEALFAAFRAELGSFEAECQRLCAHTDTSRQHPSEALREALKRAFDKVMALENLIALFGEGATANRVRSFSEHFLKQLEFALAHFPNSTNPYLAQLLIGRFSASTYFPWLEMPCIDRAISIDYRCQTMDNTLSEFDPNSFDIVHLSNILDWIEPHSAQRVLELTARVLTKGGEVIIRQLNSNLDIRGLHAGMAWNEELSTYLHRKDRSFFYRNLHVGVKSS